MSNRKKKQNRRKAQPPMQASGVRDGARSGVPEQTTAVASEIDVPVPVGGAAGRENAGLADRASRRFASLKTAREFITAAAAVIALFISIKSCRTATQSLALSQQQAEANRRYHQEHVKPDVRAVVRHASSPAQNAMAAELVVWNNGPIKAVSLTGAYRVYIVDPTNSYVYASMGISEPLVDYSFSLPEFKPAAQYLRPLLSAGPTALYVVNLVYYRETDMERYSTEDYFLFENGSFYDRESFRGRTNYSALMDSLLWKMRCEAQGGSNMYRITDPPPPGASSVNGNLSNIPEGNSPEWGAIISNRMSEVAADPGNPEVYVRRGTAFLLQHNLERAASDYERGIDLGSKNLACYINLASIRATSTNAVLRNGEQAVKLAKRGCELTGWKNWMGLANLAAAFAEAGDFDSAVTYEREVIAMPGLLPLEREAEERALARMLEHLPVREGL